MLAANNFFGNLKSKRILEACLKMKKTKKLKIEQKYCRGLGLTFGTNVITLIHVWVRKQESTESYVETYYWQLGWEGEHG